MITDESIKTAIAQTLDVLQTQWSTKVDKVQFTQGKHLSWCRSTNNYYILNFGLNMIRYCMTGGSLNHPKTRGFESIVSVATHEFCHAIQYDLGFIESRKDWHDEMFYNIYNRAMSQATQALKAKGVWRDS